MAQVLGVAREEAAELLRKGDITFILRAELPDDFFLAGSKLRDLEAIHPAAPFYAALLAGNSQSVPEKEGGRPGREMEILLFCAALESPSLPARQEAALKLISLVLEAGENSEAGNILHFLDAGSLKEKTENPWPVLRAACLYRLGRYAEAAEYLSVKSLAESTGTESIFAGWNRALTLFAEWKQFSPNSGSAEKPGKAAVAFLFEDLPAEILRWAYGESLLAEGPLTPMEFAALKSRLSPGDYRTTLSSLRPMEGELIFFRYPELIGDLGRAYQYTAPLREEGVNLFRAWNKLLDAPETDELADLIKSMDSDTRKLLKYRLLFYTGRIERARAEYAGSTEQFKKALELAPDALQRDTCVWYMLMNAFAKDPPAAASLALATMPEWNNASYFTDILDRLSCYLIRKRQWNSLAEIFRSLESSGAGGVSLAQYAWILGRAVQEGYLKTDRSAEDLFRIAFKEGKGAFYYRAMAASRLGETFVLETERNKTEKANRDKTEEARTEFILGFFKCGAASFALPYIQGREEKLSVSELAKIAEALASSGRWKESLDLVSRYTQRDDYELSRRDLLLFYPRPFLELTEKYALEAELGIEILYGLIRTESYFMPEIVSRAGAVGLTQLMTPTAMEMAGRIARRGGPDYRGAAMDLKDPEINIHLGSYYLKYLTGQMGSPMLALLSYNGGMGRMRRWLALDRQQPGGGLPHDLFLESIEFNETREYGRRVLAAAAVYGYLYYGMSMEAVAADIYRQ